MTHSPTTRPRWSETRNNLASTVGSTVTRLQILYRRETSEGVAGLAQLRRGIGRQPGDLPELWQYTEIDDETFGPQKGPDATAVEWAMHLALTLFALHQQSHRERSMHKPGIGLGTAVAELHDKSGSQLSVRRRFTAAGTAVDISELAMHLRGLVGQLRQHAIALDYGRLAADLFAWQTPRAAIGVRRVWGRDFQTTLQRFHRKAADYDAKDGS